MTTKVDNATLVAFVDGELKAAAMARVQDALAAEPQLQERAEKLRAVDAALDAAFAPILAEPLPALALTDRPPAVLAPRPLPRRGIGWAVAAGVGGLIVGFGAGQLGPDLAPADAPVAAAAIQAQLPQVLESQVSGTTVAFNDPFQGVTGTVKPLNTFVNADGRYCRTFEAHATNEDGSLTSRGVACRDDGGRWLTRVQLNAV
ncbi:MAG: RT0821/Lpp0805 family surface protein [Geminicoccaceae bacterium]